MASEKLNNTDALPKLNFDDLDEPVVYGFCELSNKNKKSKQKKEKNVSVAMVVLTILLAIAGMCCAFVFGMITNQAMVDAEQEKYFSEHVHATRDVGKAGSNAATYSDVINTKASTRFFVPMYMQWDSQWGNYEYGDGTIATHGCGLCCGAMAVQLLTGTICTPIELANLSHGSMLSDGVNDVQKIADFIYSSWGAERPMQKSQLIYNADQIYTMVNNDWIAIGSCHGWIGDFETSESWHIVLIYDVDENGFYIRDPYCLANNRQFSYEEFDGISWDYFACMKGEHVVKRY